MSLTTTVNLVPGERLTRTVDGYRMTVEAIVDGLDARQDIRLYGALLVPGMPRFGDPHPAIPGIAAVDFTAEAIGPTQIRVTIQYRSPTMDELAVGGGSIGDEAQSQISIKTSLQQVRTEKDNEGNQITVQHSFPGSEEPVVQGGEVEMSIPATTVVYSRLEQQSPGDLAKAYVGTVNSRGVFGDPARHWMCTGIDGESDNGGLTWHVTYSFQRKRNTWDATVVFIDPETNRPPPGLVQDEGIKETKVLPERDFYGIGI